MNLKLIAGAASCALLSGCFTPMQRVGSASMFSAEGNVSALTMAGGGESAFQLDPKARLTSQCKDVYAFTFGESVAKAAVDQLGARLKDSSVKVELVATAGEPFACATPAPLLTAVSVATAAYLFIGPTKEIELKYTLRAYRYGQLLMSQPVEYTEFEAHNIYGNSAHAKGIYDRAGAAMAEESYRVLRKADLL